MLIHLNEHCVVTFIEVGGRHHGSCLSFHMYVAFFFLYKIKSTCWDQTHCIEGKNVRCFLQTIDDKFIVLKLFEKELFFFFLEGENKGISSSTLVLLSCKLILLRRKKVARLLSVSTDNWVCSGKILMPLSVLSCVFSQERDYNLILSISSNYSILLLH